jgi:hypothetical protein
MRSRAFVVLATCSVILSLIVASNSAFASEKPPQGSSTASVPALVLQITVDQLRGDMLLRFHDRFARDGFRRLTGQGLYFTNANYGTGNTLQPPGTPCW